MKAVFLLSILAATVMYSVSAEEMAESEPAECTATQLSKCKSSTDLNKLDKDKVCAAYAENVKCFKDENCTLPKAVKEAIDKVLMDKGVECSGSVLTTSLLMFLISIFITMKNYL